MPDGDNDDGDDVGLKVGRADVGALEGIALDGTAVGSGTKGAAVGGTGAIDGEKDVCEPLERL